MRAIVASHVLAHGNRATSEVPKKSRPHEWYGVDYEPKLSDEARRDIATLEALQGAEFDKAFLKMFSQHHYQAAESSLQCLVARDLEHHDLHRYCENIVHAQVNEIDHMRHLACKHYEKCDIQPQHKKSRRHH